MNITSNKAGAIFFIVCTFLWFGCSKKSHYTEALSPAEEMKHFELDSSFKIELFACEPNVLSPVDMAWDEEGNIYVIEMVIIQTMVKK